MKNFQRIERLPPYIFNIINQLKQQSRERGEDVVDFGMGNPDQAAPEHVVQKLVEVVQRKDVHRYSMSRGIPRLRQAICNWYQHKFHVSLDYETEAIVTIGSKEGLSHLALSILDVGDKVLVPNPAYPIHPYSCVIAGADIQYIRMTQGEDFFELLLQAIRDSWPKPKLLVLNFPNNPTGVCVDLKFFEQVVALAVEHQILVVNDMAYAEIVFDGYKPPSILQVPDAKKVSVECYSLSKTYNMPGWRVGFMCGNSDLIFALSRMKSYVDYGLFTPIQVAAITALEGPQDCVAKNCEVYQRRRDVLCEGLQKIGWEVPKPRATMFVWAPLPDRQLGSLEFSKHLLKQAKVAVSPGIGFGEYGDGYVRFSLIENEQRTRQAIRNIRKIL